MSEEAMMAWQHSEEKLKSLNEKLSLVLSDNTAKDNLVKKHAKVAEEAVSGSLCFLLNLSDQHGDFIHHLYGTYLVATTLYPMMWDSLWKIWQI